jgi:hypothetical protein
MLLTDSINAQLGGQTVFNSLRLPTSARIAALGGNLISVKDNDLHSALFNPALLDSAMHHHAALSYVNYFSDVNMGHAAYAYRFDSIRTTISAGIRYMSYGRFDETNEIGEEIGSFTAGDYILTIGAGHRMDSNWTIGANLNFLYSQLGPFFASGASVDAAAVYERKSSGFTAALMVRNFGFQLRTYRDSDREKLPTDIQIGISKKLKHAPLRFSVIGENLQKWDLTYEDPLIRKPSALPGQDEPEDRQSGWVFGDRLMRHIVFGTEVLITENVHVRLGYNYRRRQELKIAEKPGTAGFSWGLGFRVKKIDFAYGRAIYHLAGPSHHFSVAFRTMGS